MNYRSLPSVNDILVTPTFISLLNRHSRSLVRDTLRQIIDKKRQNIEKLDLISISPEQLGHEVIQEIASQTACNLRSIINATGTVLHTNLGRAPLAESAVQAALHAASGYCDLEFDLTTGKRGKRTDVVSGIICQLTGAEAAIAVNNNAGAVILSLAALAKGGEVIISRGELVEIGGGFRVPEIMEASGCILREVGTTNRTHPRDYVSAISEQTALLMKAHRSNFELVGFNTSVSTQTLSQIGRDHHVPVLYDLGSGCMFPGEPFGWSSPLVSEEIATGVDVVTFSGDKLLGGPQAGIIAGKKTFIDRIAKHPMARALRLDKVTLATLDATLKLYLEPEKLQQSNPTIQALCTSLETLKARCNWIVTQLRNSLSGDYLIASAPTESTPGGGSLPLTRLESWAVSIENSKISATEIARKLRTANPPVISRIQKEQTLLDVRTVSDSEAPLLVQSVKQSLL